MWKIGPHLTRPTTNGSAWASRAAIVKSLDYVAPLIAAPVGAIRIFRKFYEYQEVRSGADVADEVIASLGGYNHSRLYLEMFNEWRARAEYGLAEHITMMRQFADRCHERGYKCVGFCFPTGNPEQSDWEMVRAAGFSNVDAIGLHEYWAKQGFSTWNALRSRRVHEWLGGQHPPFVITECGRDAIAGEGGAGQPGWKLQGVSAEDYAAELLAYAAELEQDDYILGAVVYTFGSWSDFAAFDAKEIAPLMPAASQEINIPEIFQGGTTTVADKEFSYGFKTLHDKYPKEIGGPVADMLAINGVGDVMQFSENGLLLYSKTANKNYFFRAARTG